jgi:hypothetical protein
VVKAIRHLSIFNEARPLKSAYLLLLLFLVSTNVVAFLPRGNQSMKRYEDLGKLIGPIALQLVVKEEKANSVPD